MCIYRYAPDSKRVERLIIWQKGVSVQIRPFAKLIVWLYTAECFWKKAYVQKKMKEMGEMSVIINSIEGVVWRMLKHRDSFGKEKLKK